MDVNLAEVFEFEGDPISFQDLKIGNLFMVPEQQQNHYWRTIRHKWQPYKSSIVFRKEGQETVQRLMSQLPTQIESVENKELIVYPVRFLG